VCGGGSRGAHHRAGRRHDEELVLRLVRLRYSGRGAETAAARGAGERAAAGIDAYAFVVAFKRVLLEGLEVAVIVLTFGASQHRIGLAAAAASAAIAVVALAGIAARAPLARVPENTMKFAVGVMLTSFGTFWGTEGAMVLWLRRVPTATKTATELA
jgi:uncharacterized membrane protein